MLTGLAMFKENPFLGVGFANYSDNYWSYAGNLGLEASARNVGSESSARQPHSLYIEIMAETGFFGVASFGLYLYYALGSISISGNERCKQGQSRPGLVLMDHINIYVHSHFSGGWHFPAWYRLPLHLGIIRSCACRYPPHAGALIFHANKLNH